MEGVHGVEREKGTAFIPGHAERHEPFREVSRRLMAEGVREAGAVALTIDLDATIIASGKRACLYACRAAEGQVPGERGCQSLIAFCPETGMVPWLEARDGNVPATRDNGRALRETLLQLPGDVRRVTLRTDGAGYQESVIRACNDPGVRGEETRRFGTIGLICGAARSEPLMVAPDKPQRECAELPHVSSECRRSLPHHVIRHVATRRALPGSLGPGEGDLPAAHGRPAHAIRACMTDFPAPDALPIEKANGLKTMHAREGVAAARDRCGHGEEVHAVLKSDLAAGMMPSGRFGANAAWLWLSAPASPVTGARPCACSAPSRRRSSRPADPGATNSTSRTRSGATPEGAVRAQNAGDHPTISKMQAGPLRTRLERLPSPLMTTRLASTATPNTEIEP